MNDQVSKLAFSGIGQGLCQALAPTPLFRKDSRSPEAGISWGRGRCPGNPGMKREGQVCEIAGGWASSDCAGGRRYAPGKLRQGRGRDCVSEGGEASPPSPAPCSPCRARAQVPAKRRQKGASQARPEPRNRARPRLRRRPACEHTVSAWGLTPRSPLLSPNSCGPFLRSTGSSTAVTHGETQQFGENKNRTCCSFTASCPAHGDLSSTTHFPTWATSPHLPTQQRDSRSACEPPTKCTCSVTKVPPYTFPGALFYHQPLVNPLKSISPKTSCKIPSFLPTWLLPSSFQQIAPVLGIRAKPEYLAEALVLTEP